MRFRAASAALISLGAAALAAAPAGAATRHYWVAAVPVRSFRVRWRERDTGTWLYHCHVETHMEQGMIGIYQVQRR